MHKLRWAGWLVVAALGGLARADGPAPVRGRVVDPDGRAVAGAEVALRSLNLKLSPGPTARTGADGRFELPRPPEWQAPPFTRDLATLTATSPGFGAGWTPIDPDKVEAEVRLVAEGPAIEGRVLDDEGHPVGGARVVVRSIHVPPRTVPEESPAAAFGRVLADRPGIVTLAAWDWFPASLRATTAGNGQFTIHGIGADQVAVLEVSGPTLATTRAEAMTRAGPAQKLERIFGDNGEHVLHPNRFDWSVGPTRIIAGAVRDADSGAPLVGWRVAGSYQEGDTLGAGETWGRTDSGGRYRLVGLPVAGWYSLKLVAPPGQPYLDASFTVVAPPAAAEPVAFDVALRRGVLVRGRVTDRATGQPVPGIVEVLPYPGEPAKVDYPEFDTSGAFFGKLAPDGRYALVAPSGRSLVAFRADRRATYRPAQGADELPGHDPGRQAVWLRPGQLSLSTLHYDVLAPLDVLPAATSARLDLRVVPEPTAELNLLDPAGAPLGGTAADGLLVHSAVGSVRLEGSRLVLIGCQSGDTRQVLIWHRGRKLAESVVAVADGPAQAVRLAPWGEVRGRVVGADGVPRGGAALVAGPFFGRDPVPRPVGIRNHLPALDAIQTDAAGHFRVEGLVPGVRHGLMILRRDGPQGGHRLAEFAVDPGEARDLGDLPVRPDPAADRR